MTIVRLYSEMADCEVGDFDGDGEVTHGGSSDDVCKPARDPVEVEQPS
jgi:hypothetical protein